VLFSFYPISRSMVISITVACHCTATIARHLPWTAQLLPQCITCSTLRLFHACSPIFVLYFPSSSQFNPMTSLILSRPFLQVHVCRLPQISVLSPLGKVYVIDLCMSSLSNGGCRFGFLDLESPQNMFQFIFFPPGEGGSDLK